MAGKRNPGAADEKADKAQKKHKRRGSFVSEISATTDQDFKPSWKTMRAAHDATIAARRLTRSMTEGPAHRRTFATAELLENIIVHLPARTILADMLRVSRFWKNVINASQAIQTKLWRRPLSDRVSSPVGLADRYSIYYNFSVRQITSDVPMYSGSYRINVVFPEAPGPLHRYESMTHVRFDVEPVYLDRTTQKKDLVQVFMARHEPSEESSETPSWLDMHLAELASTRHYSADRAPHPGLTAIQAIVRDIGGVTYGMVRDAVDKILAQPYHPHVVRDGNPAAIRICFVVDKAEIHFPRCLAGKNLRFDVVVDLARWPADCPEPRCGGRLLTANHTVVA